MTKRDRKRIQEKTLLQSKYLDWFHYRKCCISATLGRKLHIISQKGVNDATFNRAIDKSGSGSFINEAMTFGILNESKGIQDLWKLFKLSHIGSQMQRVGLCIDEDLPILVGSPDAFMSCICCGKDGKRNYFLVEIKCPFKLRCIGPSGWRELSYLTKEGKLRKTHPYYYQLQINCGINHIQKALFSIWTPQGSITLEIDFDELFYQNIKHAASDYYFNHYINNRI